MCLNPVVQSIPEALSIAINQIVYDLRRRGEDVATFSLGEAFFDIPLFDFGKLDINKGYHYSDTRGIPELREKIAGYYGKHYSAPVDPDRELLVTAGSKAAIYMAMLATLEPGDEVLIHEPGWLSYPEQTRLAGATPGYIPYDVAVSAFSDYLTPKTKILVINNPNNPSGRVYAYKELETVYELCRSRGIYLMIDEAYSDFVIDTPFTSLAEVVPDKDGIIVINSLSKNMGISGWRIGYAISSPELIDTMMKLNQHLITCAPTILSYYCATYFDDIINSTLSQATDVVKKRNRVSTMINNLKIERMAGDSTFYFMLNIGAFPGTSLEFAVHLLVEKLIAVVPGSAYGTSSERFIRFGIGTESDETIWEALQIIKQVIDDPAFDSSALSRKTAKYPMIAQLLTPGANKNATAT